MQKEPIANGDLSLPQPSLPPPSSSSSLSHHPNYPMLLAAQQQLYDYAVRLRFGGVPPPPPSGPTILSSGPGSHHPSFNDPHALYAFHQRHDPRLRCLLREEPKPSYSYIGLIAMAILSSPERKLVLSDIYQWILDHYAYFRARGPGWRNSIRHNLSLNDCFIKAGRSANGKGHYWSIHPANLADFSSGDFRRRRAQRRVRKSMGLSVPDDEEDDDEILPSNGTEHHFEHPLSKYPSDELRPNVTDLSLSSSSSSSTTTTTTTNSTGVTQNLLQRYFDDMQRVVASRLEQQQQQQQQQQIHHSQLFFPSPPQSLNTSRNPIITSTTTSTPLRPLSTTENKRKRCFDVDSLLAPEQPCLIKRHKSSLDGNEDICSPDSKSDGSTDTDISA
ncbi:unnamed protein product [Rotaria sp. Silwood1]|nr:unnamed protein product [Rotaria sp. Silwood1]CAF4776257.1 unnamed protein product [Rotaria sp. Silwood1]